MSVLSTADELADALGGTHGRIALWVGIGIAAGLGLGAASAKSERSKIESLVNNAIEAGDFEQARTLLFQALSGSARYAALERLSEIEASYHEVARWSEQLNKLVKAEQFPSAKEFVGSLNLQAHHRAQVLAQVEALELAARRRERLVKDLEQIESMARAGQVDDALAEVRLLEFELGKDQTKRLAKEVQAIAKQAREYQAKLEHWNRRLATLLERDHYDEAMTFLASIDLAPAQRREVGDRINKARIRAQLKRWNADISALLRMNRFDDALEYVRKLQIEPAEKRQATERILTAKRTFQEELRLSRAAERTALRADERFANAPEMVDDRKAPADARKSPKGEPQRTVPGDRARNAAKSIWSTRSQHTRPYPDHPSNQHSTATATGSEWDSTPKPPTDSKPASLGPKSPVREHVGSRTAELPMHLRPQRPICLAAATESTEVYHGLPTAEDLLRTATAHVPRHPTPSVHIGRPDRLRVIANASPHSGKEVELADADKRELSSLVKALRFQDAIAYISRLPLAHERKRELTSRINHLWLSKRLDRR
jgi:hypothetical protein